jgi:hypothetical protein
MFGWLAADITLAIHAVRSFLSRDRPVIVVTPQRPYHREAIGAGG